MLCQKLLLIYQKRFFLPVVELPEEFVEDMRLAVAIFWYQKGEISQEKAAQVTELNRRDFLASLAREEIDVLNVDFNDLQRELELG
ncbi:UPF0175 family protein [Okeania sp. SIO2B3]|uniref:UPF0175 family protein n=1 Tax=Okeania sp. SIO2B3 TaxID=2607784 RepID=UPI0025CCF948|nr:UPF0175 family protein [Okeania sp. SIO2B3]